MRLRRDFNDLEAAITALPFIPVLGAVTITLVIHSVMGEPLTDSLVLGGAAGLLLTVVCSAYYFVGDPYGDYGYTYQEYAWLKENRPYLCPACNNVVTLKQEVTHDKDHSGLYLKHEISCPFCQYVSTESKPLPETMNMLLGQVEALKSDNLDAL